MIHAYLHAIFNKNKKSKAHSSSFRSIKQAILISLTAFFVAGCKTETVIPNSQLASSENAVFSKNGRFFVVGNPTPESLLTKHSAIYEVIRDDDSYSLSTAVDSADFAIAGEPCQFRGITNYKNLVYAVCVYSEFGEILGQTLPLPTLTILVKLDATKSTGDDGYVETTQVFGPLISPNGMATDADGNIFVSDSTAYLSTYAIGIPAAAILKVSPSFEGGFSATYANWYPALPTDPFPNGIQILGDDLYYVTGPSLQKIQITDLGPSPAITIYDAEPCNVIDDFDIAPVGLISASEIRPTPEFDALLFPGQTCTQAPYGKLVTLSSHHVGLVYNEYIFEDGTFPSSTRFSRGDLFPPLSVLVTDYYTGGLKLVTDE